MKSDSTCFFDCAGESGLSTTEFYEKSGGEDHFDVRDAVFQINFTGGPEPQ